MAQAGGLREQLISILEGKNERELLPVLNNLMLENGKCDMKPLDEDGDGIVPSDPKYDYKSHTPFQRMAEKGYKEAINHPVVKTLVIYKWKHWAKKKFVVNFLLYLLNLFSLTFVATVAVGTSNVNRYDSGIHYARAVFELVALALVLKAIINEILQVKRLGIVYCKQLFNWVDLVSALLLFLAFPLRISPSGAHWYMFAVGYLLWVHKIFKYAVVFRQTGVYAESLRQIFLKNFLPFSVLFCIVNLAFGGTFLLVLKGDGSLDIHPETSSIFGIWYVGLRTLIEAQPVVEYTGPGGYRPLGTVIMLIFMGITTVVLLNILIAQLSETYHCIQKDEDESFLVNRAWIVARLERNMMWYPPPFSYCIEMKRPFETPLEVKSTEKQVRHSEQLEKILLKLTTIEDRMSALESRTCQDVHCFYLFNILFLFNLLNLNIIDLNLK